jgi:class 3 adenylate cyclase
MEHLSQSKVKEYNELPKEELVKQDEKPKEPPKKKPSKLTLTIRKILDNWMYQIFMTTLTVYVLFADDIKMIATDSAADDIFSSVCVAIMGMFTLEFILSSMVQDDYFLGFYFWLDLISIVSMLMDVHWFYTFLINLVAGRDTSSSSSTTTTNSTISTNATNFTNFSNFSIINTTLTNLTSTNTTVSGSSPVPGGAYNKNVKTLSAIAKAGRGAKVGSRAIRVLRILRIIRLARISKLYKASEKLIEEKLNRSMMNKKLQEQGNFDPNDTQRRNEAVPEESKVGKKLLDLTTRRVIILVLAMMMGIILFDSSFYLSPLTSMNFGIKIFNDFDSVDVPEFNLTFDIYVNEHRNISSPIIFAQVGFLSYGDFGDTLLLREEEKIFVSDDCGELIPNNTDYSICVAVFDDRANSHLSSILNILKTIFICLVFSGGAIWFSKDTSEMVLEPIESMIKKIKEISKNPIEAMQNNEKEDYAKSLLEQEDKDKKGCMKFFSCKDGESKKKEAPLETVVLENTITKIGALLALGFGEAGSEIIAKNMQNNTKGDVNPILPGKKVMAIYGFCDIRNFTDTTEVLQEKVMIFVNEIAEIVHEITAEHCGSANKNIGDAFLLVWKFEDEFTDNTDGALSLKNINAVNQICDMALISFIKILGAVHKSFKLDKYRKNEGLNKRIKNYCVKMGFGLHLGWSIEGAIGSTFKIDASYLSPNVNTASKLEEKTKEYGVQLVISGEFIKYISAEAKKRVRIIDKFIGETGEEETVYTVDIDTNSLKIEDQDPEEDNRDGNENIVATNLVTAISMKKLEKYKKRLKRKFNYQDAIEGVRNVWREFEESDIDYSIMRRKFTEEFYENYNKGFDNFMNGDWNVAKKYFEAAEEVLGDKDGPTENLMHIMKEHNFVKPHDWKGNRSEGGH